MTTTTFELGGDLAVERLGFGAMRLSAEGFQGPRRDPDTAGAVLRRAVELGVNHIDTAAFYGINHRPTSNTLIREVLQPYPPGLVIATKVGPRRTPNGGLTPSVTDTTDGLRASVEENLETLGVDLLDLVYLRVGGLDGPGGGSLAKRFEALCELRDEGLIRHLGLSNVSTEQLAQARAIGPVAAVQNHFHIAKQDGAAVLDTCRAADIAFVPFFPLGGGRTDISGERLAKVAIRHRSTIRQVALAWLLAFSPVNLAIPGTASLAHLEENMAARSIALTPDDLVELETPRVDSRPNDGSRP